MEDDPAAGNFDPQRMLRGDQFRSEAVLKGPETLGNVLETGDMPAVDPHDLADCVTGEQRAHQIIHQIFKGVQLVTVAAAFQLFFQGIGGVFCFGGIVPGFNAPLEPQQCILTGLHCLNHIKIFLQDLPAETALVRHIAGVGCLHDRIDAPGCQISGHIAVQPVGVILPDRRERQSQKFSEKLHISASLFSHHHCSGGDNRHCGLHRPEDRIHLLCRRYERQRGVPGREPRTGPRVRFRCGLH